MPVGSPAFVLTSTGTGFTPTTVGRVSGTNRATTYLSPTQVRITVPASALVKRGKVSIAVQNPSIAFCMLGPSAARPGTAVRSHVAQRPSRSWRPSLNVNTLNQEP